MKSVKFGMRTPGWPPVVNALVVVIASRVKRFKLPYPLPKVVTSPAEEKMYLKRFEGEINSLKNIDRIYFETVYSARLEFDRKIPLIPEYWRDGQPAAHYDDLRRKLFVDMFADWKPEDEWRVVVTPSGLKRGKEILRAGFPVKREKVATDVEAFMRYSDWYVDPTADSAGLYNVTGITGRVIRENRRS